MAVVTVEIVDTSIDGTRPVFYKVAAYHEARSLLTVPKASPFSDLFREVARRGDNIIIPFSGRKLAKWSVCQRYSTLHAMVETLRAQNAVLPSIPFPQKQWNLPIALCAQGMLEERRSNLETYLRALSGFEDTWERAAVTQVICAAQEPSLPCADKVPAETEPIVRVTGTEPSLKDEMEAAKESATSREVEYGAPPLPAESDAPLFETAMQADVDAVPSDMESVLPDDDIELPTEVNVAEALVIEEPVKEEMSEQPTVIDVTPSTVEEVAVDPSDSPETAQADDLSPPAETLESSPLPEVESINAGEPEGFVPPAEEVSVVDESNERSSAVDFTPPEVDAMPDVTESDAAPDATEVDATLESTQAETLEVENVAEPAVEESVAVASTAEVVVVEEAATAESQADASNNEMLITRAPDTEAADTEALDAEATNAEAQPIEQQVPESSEDESVSENMGGEDEGTKTIESPVTSPHALPATKEDVVLSLQATPVVVDPEVTALGSCEESSESLPRDMVPQTVKGTKAVWGDGSEVTKVVPAVEEENSASPVASSPLELPPTANDNAEENDRDDASDEAKQAAEPDMEQTAPITRRASLLRRAARSLLPSEKPTVPIDELGSPSNAASSTPRQSGSGRLMLLRNTARHLKHRLSGGGGSGPLSSSSKSKAKGFFSLSTHSADDIGSGELSVTTKDASSVASPSSVSSSPAVEADAVTIVGAKALEATEDSDVAIGNNENAADTASPPSSMGEA